MSTVPKRLLIVDDDPGVVDYLVEMLEHQGYAVQGLTSPQRALDQIAEDRFDLVITDVEMPAMRGLDLMAAIHARHPNQLVLLITAFGSIDLAVQSVRTEKIRLSARRSPPRVSGRSLRSCSVRPSSASSR
jgi:DNA-binding NtrC family response regulator